MDKSAKIVIVDRVAKFFAFHFKNGSSLILTPAEKKISHSMIQIRKPYVLDNPVSSVVVIDFHFPRRCLSEFKYSRPVQAILLFQVNDKIT